MLDLRNFTHIPGTPFAAWPYFQSFGRFCTTVNKTGHLSDYWHNDHNDPRTVKLYGEMVRAWHSRPQAVMAEKRGQCAARSIKLRFRRTPTPELPCLELPQFSALKHVQRFNHPCHLWHEARAAFGDGAGTACTAGALAAVSRRLTPAHASIKGLRSRALQSSNVATFAYLQHPKHRNSTEF